MISWPLFGMTKTAFCLYYWRCVHGRFADEELADFHALCESSSGAFTAAAAVTSFPSSATALAPHPGSSLLHSRTTLHCAASRHFPATGACRCALCVHWRRQDLAEDGHETTSK